ncbi:hypothetical protein [Chengkuizengella axinellae]|uniref:SMODS-associating 2TM beta-strand rich effector domain-containing protein n=1 Tax=Chengkuizengella axinellae TaxID=3064388 RepID=A0ABT9IU22_9BACL|nr:hypothetical protein [Chengkuizengella sp. 2205SS18-9]MDP5272843.1 hypothetical protein [Chengkuizengella sp. 2205SS18-9]
MTKNKNLKYIFLILLSILLMGNTNNHPTPFHERIFPPIHTSDSSTFYYSGIMLLVLMYYGYKGLLSVKKDRTNIGLKAIIFTILTPLLMSNLWEDGIKLYKSYFDNLNAVYSYHEEKSISYRTEGSEAIINGKIHLENLSDIQQEFFIKITFSSYWGDNVEEKELFALEEDLNSRKSFILYANENKMIEFVLDGTSINPNSQGSGFTNVFDYVLIQGSEEVSFTSD